MPYSKTAVVKCENCGADLVWNASKGVLQCAYCDSTKAVEKRISKMRDYYKCVAEGYVEKGGVVYKCPNCHAETTVESFESAINCAFCGATNIMRTEELPGLKPDSILPFKLSKADAVTAGQKWIKRKIFAPSKCKKSFNPEKFNGIYIPNFSFDTNTVSKYKGMLGQYYYVTVGSGKDKKTVRKTRWFHVSGTLRRDFSDIVIEASTKLDQKQLGKILPFDLVAAEEYNKSYLAGYSAERYNTSLEDSFSSAKVMMENEIRKLIIRKYNADVVGSLSVSTQYNPIYFRYILLPIWISGYSFKEKLYQYIVNGRTGKSTGKAPISPLRVLLAVLFGIGVVALIVYLLIKSDTINFSALSYNVRGFIA